MTQLGNRGPPDRGLPNYGQSPTLTLKTPSCYDAFPGCDTIGLALGSPRQNLIPPLPLEGAEREIPTKRRIRKWKTFGGLFSKKEEGTPDSPCHSSQHSPYRERSALRSLFARDINVSPACEALTEAPDGNPWLKQSILQERSPEAGSNSLRRRISTRRNHFQKKVGKDGRKAHLGRSHTAPLLRPGESSSKMASGDRGEKQSCQLLPFEEISLLQVEIPNVEMERYSVMFGSLLQPSTSSSLLARRHGHLDELKTMAAAPDKIKLPPQYDELPKRACRAASTPPARSPSFSLFPTTSSTSARIAARRLAVERSPLFRSMTAPSARSPSCSIFNVSGSQDQNHVIDIVNSPARTSATPASSRRAGSNLDISHRPPSSTEVSLVETANLPIFELCHIAVSKCKKDTFPVRKSSIVAPQNSPQEMDSVLSLSPIPAILHARVDAPKEVLGDAAEISIARQISVSRRQRHLLVPIVPKAARQPMQPTLVDVQEASSACSSHYLILDNA